MSGRKKILFLFFGWLVVMLVVVLLTLPDHRPRKIDNIGFKTSEQDQLYFNNVRRYYYTYDEEGGKLLDSYRLKASGDSADYGPLHFVIFQAWKQNEAFIRLDTARAEIWKNSKILICVPDSNKCDTLHLPDFDNESQYWFARTVYLAIEANKKFFWMKSSRDLRPILEKHETKKEEEEVLTDYFKLVNKI